MYSPVRSIEESDQVFNRARASGHYIPPTTCLCHRCSQKISSSHDKGVTTISQVFQRAISCCLQEAQKSRRRDDSGQCPLGGSQKEIKMGSHIVGDFAWCAGQVSQLHHTSVTGQEKNGTLKIQSIVSQVG